MMENEYRDPSILKVFKRATLGCTEPLLAAQSHSWLHRATPGSTEPLLAAQSHSWQHRATPGCTEPLLAAQSHSWLHRATPGSTGHYLNLASILSDARKKHKPLDGRNLISSQCIWQCAPFLIDFTLHHYHASSHFCNIMAANCRLA